MHRFVTLFFSFSLIATAWNGAVAQEAPPGASSCSGCHGPQIDAALSLNGLSADDIIKAFEEFKSGARPATIMGRIAPGYSDTEIAAIADWIAQQNAAGQEGKP